MKINKKSKYLLAGGAIIGAIAIIAGSTAAVAVHSNNKLVAASSNTNTNNQNSISSSSNQHNDKSSNSGSTSTSNNKNHVSSNNNDGSSGHGSKVKPDTKNQQNNHDKENQTPGEKNDSSDGSSSNDSNNQKVVNLLDSLLSNIINVSQYDEMSSNTVQEAFSVQKTLEQAINSAIENEIQNDASKFLSINSNYSIKNIVDNIQITLPKTISAEDIELAQISNVNLSYENTLLTNSSNTSNFIVEGFQSTVSSSDIQSINKQIAKMIETNVNNIIEYNLNGSFVAEYLFSNKYYSDSSYSYTIPNAIILSNFNNITAGQALNIQKYKQEWINALENQIIGASNKTFTFNDLTFTEPEIAANLTINIDQWQFVNNHGEICGVTLSYAGVNLTFNFPAPPKNIQNLVEDENQNQINIFGFLGFYSWQGIVCGMNHHSAPGTPAPHNGNDVPVW